MHEECDMLDEECDAACSRLVDTLNRLSVMTMPRSIGSAISRHKMKLAQNAWHPGLSSVHQ